MPPIKFIFLCSLFLPSLTWAKTCEEKIRERTCMVATNGCASDSPKYADHIVEVYQNSHPVVKNVLCSIKQITLLNMSALGQTQIIYDSTGVAQRAQIYIKKSLLINNLNAEQVHSWKEQKIFGIYFPEFDLSPNGPHYKMPTLKAVEYVITHEVGHIVDLFNQANQFKCIDSSCGDPFDAEKVVPIPGSWGALSWENIAKVNQANSFPLLAKLCFYGCTPVLTEADATQLYFEFSTTAFPTLYSLMSPQEDFAESFTYNLLIRKRNLSAHLDIQGISFSLSDRWNMNSAKISWLESFLASPLKYPRD